VCVCVCVWGGGGGNERTFFPDHIWARHLPERSDQDTPLNLEEPRYCSRASTGAAAGAPSWPEEVRERARLRLLGLGLPGSGAAVPPERAGAEFCRAAARVRAVGAGAWKWEGVLRGGACVSK